MSKTTQGYGTLAEVITQLLGSIALYELVWMVMKYFLNTNLTWEWGIATAAFLASFNVARQYRTGAPEDRLAPVPAITYGLLCIGLIAGALAIDRVAPVRTPTVLVLVTLSVCALTTPSLYLLAAGIRRITHVSS